MTSFLDFDFFGNNFHSISNKTKRQRRGRTCRFEELEGREMLSVTPWSLTDDYADGLFETSENVPFFENNQAAEISGPLLPLGADDLAIPANFRVTGSTITSISLTWDSTGASSYEIRYKIRGAADWQTPTWTGTGTMATISSLNTDTEYEFQIRAVYGGQSHMSDYSNYSTPSIFGRAVGPRPDLVASDGGSVPSSVYKGSTFSVTSAQIHNIGESASGNYTVTFYALTSSSASVTSGINIGSVSMGNLAVDASTTAVANNLSTTSLNAGTSYYIGWYITGVNGEIDTSNNAGRSQTMVRIENAPTPADLAASNGGSLTPNVVDKGDSFTVTTGTIQNIGGAPSGAYIVTFYASTSESTLFTSGFNLGAVVMDDLAANGTATATRSLSAASLTAGTYYIGWRITGVHGETNTTNNTARCTAQLTVLGEVVPKPDLTASNGGSITPGSVVKGNMFSVTTGTIQNVGDAASGNYTITYYAAANESTLFTSGINLGSFNMNDLGAGASTTDMRNLSTALLDVGSYYIGWRITNVNGESNTENNMARSTTLLTVTEGFVPDLATSNGGTVTTPVLPEMVNKYYGETFSITTAQIKNIGEADSGDYTVTFYAYALTDSTSLFTSKIEIGSVGMTSLGVDQTDTATINVSSDLLTNGFYFVGWTIMDVSGEVSLGNNSGYHLTPLRVVTAEYNGSGGCVGGTPDLETSNGGIVTPYPVEQGSPLSVASEAIRNIGDSTFGGYIVTFYASPEYETLFTSGTIIGFRFMDDLVADGTTVASLDNISTALLDADSSYYIGWRVSGVINEVNLENNTGYHKDAAKLDAPTLTKIEKIGSRMVRVEWTQGADNVGNIFGYEIEYSTDNFATISGSEFVGPATTSFILEGLDKNTTYYIRVVAISNNTTLDNSDPSNVLNTGTQKIGLDTPEWYDGTGGGYGEGSESSCSLAWWAVEDATDYEVWIKIEERWALWVGGEILENSKGSWNTWDGTPLPRGTLLTATITGLPANGNYEFKLRATTDDDKSAFTSSRYCTTIAKENPTVAAKPKVSVVKGTTIGSITLKITTSGKGTKVEQNAESFLVSVKDKNGIEVGWYLVNAAEVTDRKDNIIGSKNAVPLVASDFDPPEGLIASSQGLNPAAKYTFTVQSVNKDGYGKLTTNMSEDKPAETTKTATTTKYTAVKGLKVDKIVSKPTLTSLTLQWNKVGFMPETNRIEIKVTPLGKSAMTIALKKIAGEWFVVGRVDGISTDYHPNFTVTNIDPERLTKPNAKTYVFAITIEGLLPSTKYGIALQCFADSVDESITSGKAKWLGVKDNWLGQSMTAKTSVSTQKYVAVKGLKSTRTEGNITLTWKAHPNLATTGYEVYWGDTKGNPLSEIQLVSGRDNTKDIAVTVTSPGSGKQTLYVRAVGKENGILVKSLTAKVKVTL